MTTERLVHLWPRPKEVHPDEGRLILPDGLMIQLTNAPQTLYPIARSLQAALVQRTQGAVQAQITAAQVEIGGPHVSLRVDDAGLPYAEAYRLRIDADGVFITGADAAGVFYALQTLVQLWDLTPEWPTLPCVEILDWPDFAHRGVMLDVSRDKVPTMETLYGLVDFLATLKVNQIQLYMEHTFAYLGHEVVWRDASPFTGEEMLALDAYCRERFVTLVPNQNSFGHMHRWLIHEPYRQLAECPDGVELWPGYTGEPFSLCPTDPGSLDLLRDLYDQLLPHFSSELFNVGLDETFDLGRGRSAQACATRGTERVYLEFLNQVYGLVRERGRRMQFWGDIILHQPELIAELPQDAIALEWGYEAAHPFAEHCALFAEAGLAFYVCPGTSSWNTIAGRTDNALMNIQNAAVHGKAAGAMGLLNTDWGDNGHMQPLSVSYLGFLAGAGASWNAEVDLLSVDLPTLLDRYAFEDHAGVMGEVACRLGNVYQLPGISVDNASILFLLLGIDRPLSDEPFAGLTEEALHRTVEAIDAIAARLPQSAMARADADWVLEEFSWAADALRWSCILTLERLRAGQAGKIAAIPAATREQLATRLEVLITRFRTIWLRRNRPGGLPDSAARMERVLAALRA